MRKFIWLIVAVVLVAVLVGAGVLYSRLSVQRAPEQESAVQEEQTALRDAAADFVVLNDDGSDDYLSSHIGKPVIVNFWATWCGYCVQEMPAFNAAAEKYGDKVDFMMVDLTDGRSETVESARAFVQENGFTFPVYYDTKESAAAAYGVYSIPVTLFVSADGSLLDSHVGAMSEELLEQSIQTLLQTEG